MYNSIDIFSGMGGLTEGMKQAGFKVIAAVEIDKDSIDTYRLNHPEVKIFNQDIRTVDTSEIKKLLKGKPLQLLAGCPPCQGFSSVRRLNRKEPIQDERNDLILEFLRFVKELEPLTIMMENVPGLKNYELYRYFIDELKRLGYDPDDDVKDVQDFEVPQRRKRLVVVGSQLGTLKIADGSKKKHTVKHQIGNLKKRELKKDKVHQIVASHTEKIQKMIELIPKDGGSRTDLPEEYILECHKKANVGFNDVYGRLRWNDFSSTITGGCLNPSKGRFLHPEENRCITAREAALLQTFPIDYKFPENISKTSIAKLIGNALPPKFSEIQCKNIYEHLKEHLG
jgi:DNA (cytosine-5)-methyltransferase 1